MWNTTKTIIILKNSKWNAWSLIFKHNNNSVNTINGRESQMVRLWSGDKSKEKRAVNKQPNKWDDYEFYQINMYILWIENIEIEIYPTNQCTSSFDMEAFPLQHIEFKRSINQSINLVETKPMPFQTIPMSCITRASVSHIK